MIGLLSLQETLSTALNPVVEAVLAETAGTGDRASHRPDQALSPSPWLRLGRSRHTLSYLYQPPSDQTPPSPALTQAILATWRQSKNPITDLPSLVRAHTAAQELPSGQILLFPDATALGGWLWVFLGTESGEEPWSLPHPAPLFPQKRALLAEHLQLSPLAVLQYTHGRCHQLAQRSAAPIRLADPYHPKNPEALPGADWLGQLAPTTPASQQVLRALVKLVDQIALPPALATELLHPRCLDRAFGAGYQLCVAVHPWLGELTVDTTSAATTVLLRAVKRGLNWLLTVWMQCPAPDSL